MTRTPQQRTKKKSPWDRAIQAPRISFEPSPEPVRCANPDCGHARELHDGWHIGQPKKCCYFGVGGRDQCRCRKFKEA